MHPTLLAANPFAMLIDPDAVLSAVHGSEHLNRLAGRICRPLDRQVTPADSAPRTDDVELLGAVDGEFASTC